MLTWLDDRGKLECPPARAHERDFICTKYECAEKLRFIVARGPLGRAARSLLLTALRTARCAAPIGEFHTQIDRHHGLAAAVAIDAAHRRDVGIVASDRDRDMTPIDGT